jgi:ribosomal protein S18 acetylase RimI-like enzyme
MAPVAPAVRPVRQYLEGKPVWKTRRPADKAQILAYLETDRLYAAYAIGDLEPGMYEQCAWAGAERAGRLEALALLYRGLEPPPLFLMGEVEGLRAIFAETLCPERVHLMCLEGHLPLTREFYGWHETTPMWRMVLQPGRFRPVASDAIRLAPGQSGQLTELYALGGGGAFSPAQVGQGVFFGIWAEGQLVAAAGTHLVSTTYGVGAVGNVFVHPERRGRGYGTAVTSAVLAELLDRGIRDVILNVSQDNAAAIHVYENLGFERYCSFLEGSAIKRGHNPPGS